jgi:SNF2 family DNA or RNA helicase
VTPLPLLPYQVEAAEVLATKERYGLWDEMGVGKTATAIGALDRLGAKRVMIVAPAAVREVWVGEIKKFATIPRKVVKGKSIHDFGMWLKGRADVLVTSYEMATKWAPKIDDLYDALILDEAHYLKSFDAQRTRALLGTQCDGKKGAARWASHVWFLTGTPAPNDPIDVWPFLRFTGATNLTIAQFTARYFTSRMGTFSARQEPRKETIDELRRVVHQNAIRRTKADVGMKLPPIWLTTQTVDGDTTEVRELLRSYPGLADAIIEAIEKGGLSFLDAQHIATLRRLVGEAKAPAFVDLMLEELHNGLEKVVIMGVHTKALDIVRDGLAAHGHRVVMITGATSERDRIAAVKDFQTDPATRVFIGNVRAAGTGITLTAASDIVMFESSWSPADNAQALMRIHRLGQTATRVRARFISLAGSIDEVVSETVARKTATIARLGLDLSTDAA